jgi:hypothetical protein
MEVIEGCRSLRVGAKASVLGRRRTHIWPRISRRNASTPTACGLRKRWRGADKSERSQGKHDREKFIGAIKSLHVTFPFNDCRPNFGLQWTAASCCDTYLHFELERGFVTVDTSRLRDRSGEVCGC